MIAATTVLLVTVHTNGTIPGEKVKRSFNFHQYIACSVPNLSHFYSRKFFLPVSFFAFNYLCIHLLVLFTDLVDIKPIEHEDVKTIEQEVTYKVKPPTKREKLSSHTINLKKKKRKTRMKYKKITCAHL